MSLRFDARELRAGIEATGLVVVAHKHLGEQAAWVVAEKPLTSKTA